ncbi:MAG: glutamate-5-semialdehyde dehydrogenase [Ruminococcaceae bacterium]|nr:glutamate-5-semialdehyde dehydrogenase [Oscillospiraceae bacterium]
MENFNIEEYLTVYGKVAKKAAFLMGMADTNKKNTALKAVAEALVDNSEKILKANDIDLENAVKNGMSVAMQDRLRLTEDRIKGMAEGLVQLTSLPDPIGEVIDGFKRPNGLQIVKRRVPLGVLGIIFESRPNVTADAAGLCIKSGNACILRGGKEAINSNIAIAEIFSETLEASGLPKAAVQLIDNTSREVSTAMMKLNDYIDVLIPRGGAGLIRSVVQNATVPVIQTGTGNCHVFVDETADLDMAVNIVMNAKTQRPSVCNAMETLLVHENIAEKFLNAVCVKLKDKNVELRGCEKSKSFFADMNDATEDDWKTEYDDLILAVKVVSGVEEAVEHINNYGTRHSEAIITKNFDNATKFQNEIDASCVYVNASTRFTDGFEFGFGAEIGISNQKLHARGPMGLTELTTFKYLISGNGQCRG